MAVDLATAKIQLNLTTTDDDVLVTRLLKVAQEYVESQLGYNIVVQPASALEHAIYLLVGHLYANREASVIGVNAAELPLGVSDIINNNRNWSWC